MAADPRLAPGSIEEMLVALAQGLRDAQQALDTATALDAAGRPVAGYHLPYLDFSIQMQVTTTRAADGRAVALLQPAALLAPGASTSSSELRSAISGRFVAVPAGDGLPLPLLRLRAAAAPDDAGPAPDGGRVVAVIIELSNSAGERLAGQRVELNIDDEASRRLSAARGGSWQRRPGTRLRSALVRSDETGRARALLDIAAGHAAGTVVVVEASIGTQRAELAVAAGS